MVFSHLAASPIKSILRHGAEQHVATELSMVRTLMGNSKLPNLPRQLTYTEPKQILAHDCLEWKHPSRLA
jgi:hypothetical protein